MTHVLIPDYPIRVQYTVGDTPSAGPFAWSFTFFAVSDIHVYLGDSELAANLFIVAGNPGTEGGFAGGSLTLGPINNTTLTIIRQMPIERVSDFPDAGSFNRRTLNTTLDKHVAMIQQVDERVDRSVIFPPGWVNNPGIVANAFIQGNPAGTGWELLQPLQVRTEIQAQPLNYVLNGLSQLGFLPTIFEFPVHVGASLAVGGSNEQWLSQPLTPYGATLIGLADAAAGRSALGLGSIATQNAHAVAITGGTMANVTMTGGSISGTPINTPSFVSPNVAITGGSITGMPQPSAPSDVVTKQYADSLAIGVSKRSTARASGAANVSLPAMIAGSVLDGVTLATSDRVLLKDQTNQAENGVYVIGAGAPVRAADFDTYNEYPGSLVTVQEGTVGQDRVYLCVSNVGGTLESTAIQWEKVQVSPALPVVIAEGGTGQVTAAAAFNALKQLATASSTGVDLLHPGYNVMGRNGGFEVWQATGTVDTALTGPNGRYFADGWHFANSAAGHAHIIGPRPGLSAASSNCMVIMRTAGSAGLGGVWLEYALDYDEIRHLCGGPCVLSFLSHCGNTFLGVNGPISIDMIIGTGAPVRRSVIAYENEAYPLSGTFTPTGAVQQYVFQGSPIPAGSNQATILVRWSTTGTAGAQDWLFLDDFMLESGGVVHPFQRMPAQQQLSLCQRHYWKTFTYGVTPAWNVGGLTGELGQSVTTAPGAQVNFFETCPVTMRVAPTVTAFNPANINNQVRVYDVSNDCTATYVSYTTQQRIRLTGVLPGGVAVGMGCGVHLVADARI